eukprot:jgi/Mesen1/9098/ME000058S08593
MSVDKARAAAYVAAMHAGFEEYGCRANEAKTRVSFELGEGVREGEGRGGDGGGDGGETRVQGKAYRAASGALFMPWAGLLINVHTLEVQADYTRYGGDHIASSLTVARARHPGANLAAKLCQFLRPKCHALLYDPTLNSPATVRVNAYQAFVLCAMKMHSYLRCMPPGAHHNPAFLFCAILGAIRYMERIICQCLLAAERLVGGPVGPAPSRAHVEWLGLTAFHRVLKRKQSRFRALLQLLRRALGGSRQRKLERVPELVAAVDERNSCMLANIKY